MRAEGHMMTPRFCNGSQLPASYLDTDVDPSMGAMWVATNTSGWLSKLPSHVFIADSKDTEWVSAVRPSFVLQ
jgi:hypothetical protein